MKLVSRLLFATGGHILPDSHLYLPPHLCCSCCTNANGRLPVVVVRNPFSRLASNWRTLNSATLMFGIFCEKSDMCQTIWRILPNFLPAIFEERTTCKHLQRSFNLGSLGLTVIFPLQWALQQNTTDPTAKALRSLSSFPKFVSFVQGLLTGTTLDTVGQEWVGTPKIRLNLKMTPSFMFRWKERFLYKAIILKFHSSVSR